MYNYISGGVCAPEGFSASGVHCGIRRNTEKYDLALIFADTLCSAAAVYTQNRVKSSPIYATKRNLENGRARAILVNSGIANACAPDGDETVARSLNAAASALGISPSDFIVNSTGIIGQRLPVEKIEAAIPALVKKLSPDSGGDAALAIMTTDTVKKELALQYENKNGETVKIGAICKGSGMIHPNMATMLCFITTNAALDSAALNRSLKRAADMSFNRISVDGDQSTNDMTAVLASNAVETGEDEFTAALTDICVKLAKKMAADGEGATKLITCRVSNADSEDNAAILAKSVIASSLVKTAMFGADANCGRVLCALGYAGVEFDPARVDVKFGDMFVCKNGLGLAFDENLAKEILLQKEILIDIDMKSGGASAEAYGCDLSYEYVKINGDYRS